MILYIDEGNRMFSLCRGSFRKEDNPDVFTMDELINCDLTVGDSKKEIQYKDSNGKLRSFRPPYYGYSYDFYVYLDFNLPWIQCIKLKFNSSPVDNGQDAVIDYSSESILRKIGDAIAGDRGFNGKTSNADEVMASTEYRNYEALAYDIKNTLMTMKRVSDRIKTGPTFIKCPWCGGRIPGTALFCPHCNAPVQSAD